MAIHLASRVRLTGSATGSETASAAMEDERTPMPTAGRDGIKAIMDQSRQGMIEAMTSRPAGLDLGNVVSGSHPTVIPPARQINGVNAALVAAALGVGCADAFSKKEKQSGVEGTKVPAGSTPPTIVTTRANAQPATIAVKPAKPALPAAASRESSTVTDTSLSEKARSEEVSGKALQPLSGPVYAPEKTVAGKTKAPDPAVSVAKQSVSVIIAVDPAANPNEQVAPSTPPPSPVCDPSITSCPQA